MTLELAHRPMHYCSICIQPPDRCGCAWAREAAELEDVTPAPGPPPEPDPSPDTQATLPIEWPERKDIGD